MQTLKSVGAELTTLTTVTITEPLINSNAAPRRTRGRKGRREEGGAAVAVVIECAVRWWQREKRRRRKGEKLRGGVWLCASRR